MKVYFERTGGFAGMRISAMFDTDVMPDADSEKLYELCNLVNFFNLPAKTEINNDAADVFHYKITVESKNVRHTIETTDLSMTNEFAEFVNYLSDKALRK